MNSGPTEEELMRSEPMERLEMISLGQRGLLNGDNWAGTRYVPWTSWLVAKSVWSHTTYAYKGQGENIDGLPEGADFNISVQGESDGMATFAMSSVTFGIFATTTTILMGSRMGRTYTGPWELMSRGSFAGPEGTHTRWQIPSLNGSAAPAPHTTRFETETRILILTISTRG